jgi:hypothetical protein
MKKINRYSIDKYFKKLEIETEKKTPKDILKVLKKQRFSESLNGPIAYGKMDLIHFIRSTIKDNNFWIDQCMKLKQKNRKLKRLINDI